MRQRTQAWRQGDSGLIRYHRGEIEVRNRSALEARACSCYESDRSVYRTHLPG